MLRSRLYNPPTPSRLAKALRIFPFVHPPRSPLGNPSLALSQLAWAHLEAVEPAPAGASLAHPPIVAGGVAMKYYDFRELTNMGGEEDGTGAASTSCRLRQQDRER
jgi:hypothetical protein